MARERHAVVYPGVHRVGLSLWVIDSGVVIAVAVGSLGKAELAGTLHRFAVDTLHLEGPRREGPRDGPFSAPSSVEVRFVHPGWRYAPGRKPVNDWKGLGPLAYNAWRMGKHALVERGDYVLGRLTLDPLTLEWVETHSPTRRKHDP
jgi:hypothetical protein